MSGRPAPIFQMRKLSRSKTYKRSTISTLLAKYRGVFVKQEYSTSLQKIRSSTGFFFALASRPRSSGGRSQANPAGEDCHGVICAADEAGQNIVNQSKQPLPCRIFFALASRPRSSGGRSQANPAGADCHGVICAADEAGQNIVNQSKQPLPCRIFFRLGKPSAFQRGAQPSEPDLARRSAQSKDGRGRLPRRNLQSR